MLYNGIIFVNNIMIAKIKNKDIYFAILLFIFYNFWIYINETNLYEIIGEINYNQGPLFLFVKSWFPR